MRAQAVAQIEAAFAETPAPSPEGDWHTFYECADLKAEWQGQHWRDLTTEMIFNWRDCVTNLAPEAFRFYLPAFMIHSLLHPHEVDTLLDSILVALAPSSGQPFSTHHNRKLVANASIFTSAEAEAVLAFLPALKSWADGVTFSPYYPYAEVGQICSAFLGSGARQDHAPRRNRHILRSAAGGAASPAHLHGQADHGVSCADAARTASARTRSHPRHV
ncbi:DUF6714 family protein [Candidatus Flexifilum breve]|uniref:DUF6714 family protein n=1 Tax=Candidatus Flexifilum breve TaxID=3140694 RepID=UPI0031CCCD2E